jgi:hypothetical protein
MRLDEGVDPFVEEFVDRQIDAFIGEIRSKLEELKTNLSVAEKLRERLISENMQPSVLHSAVRAFDAALEETEDSADDLRDMLSTVLVGLERKGSFKESIFESSYGNWYEKEVRYIRERITDSEKRIHSYLFESRNVVHANELKEESMMTCLFFAEQMAKIIRKDMEKHNR